MEAVFWICVIGVIYSYVLYPLILLPFSRARGRAELGGEHRPQKVSFIITAHNESGRIKDKLENTLSLKFPADRLEVIVASDGSDDDTDAIVKSYAGRGVRLVETHGRLGKERTQLKAIEESKGGFLVFSDVGTGLASDGLDAILAPFGNPDIGAVSSEDRFIANDGQIVGEGLYVKYEMWLRRLESRASGLIGLSGSLFAARRAVCEGWDPGVPSDFNTAMNCARLGLRAVSEPRALGYYPDLSDSSKEYRRKLRTVVRGIAGMAKSLDVLNPFRYGGFAFQVWSHKIARWLVPWFMLGALILNCMLAVGNAFYVALLATHLGLYAAAGVGRLMARHRDPGWFRIPLYFLEANLAIAHAWILVARGERFTTWQPSKR